MTVRGAALLLACCISLAWVIPPRRAMAQNTSAVAVGARQSGSAVVGGVGGFDDLFTTRLLRSVAAPR